MKRLIASLCLLAAFNTFAGEWLQSVTIGIEPPDEGQQILNVCFKPAKSIEYDLLTFECIYRQEFPWQDAKGKPINKIIEPVTFTYPRKGVKLVADLDAHVCFRVPVSLPLLLDKYGPNIFVTNAPVVIDRMRISGEKDNARLWTQELRVPGKHAIKDTPPPKPEVLPPKNSKFGTVNLD